MIEYLFEFLNAYDFASEGSEEIQEENKRLINASVLGLIFEKINGYKDGSFFTPGFITMYMCRETIRRAVVQKFNERKGWNCENLSDLYDKIEDRREANEIINELKICDPAVGSGHFLVSALNEIIAVKSEMKILCDRNGKRLKEYDVAVENDELVITDDDGELFEYNPQNSESRRVQEALFHEKELIIENCLFGVDINPNSVKICRLRLWIELLKNAYYKSADSGISDSCNSSQFVKFEILETLPNIDINIKCGNSLISRYALDADIKQALRKSKWSIDSYRLAIMSYRNAQSKEEKRELEKLISTIKNDFESEIATNDKRLLKLNKAKGELYALTNQNVFFEKSKAEKAIWNKQVKTLAESITKLEAELDEIRNNKIYENAFEWRFEFPEVLNDEGGFVGFDVVIGNPPYLSGSSFRECHNYFNSQYFVAEYQLDLYTFFIELSLNISKHKGYQSLITPNSWLKNIRMMKTRSFVLNNSNIISLNSNISKAFDEAQVDNLIYLSTKDKSSGEIQIWTFNSDQSYVSKHYLNQDLLNNNVGLIFDVEVNPEVKKVLSKIRKRSRFLEDDFEITRGVNPYDAYTGQSAEVIKSKAYHADFKKNETFVPEIRGKHVSTYQYLWDKKHYISYGNWLAAPRDPKFFIGKRIVFREILGKRFVCTLIEEPFVIDRSLYIAKPKSEKTDVKYVLGVLASKLIIWLFKLEKNEFDDLFPKIRVEEFKKLPVPNQVNESPISKLVEQILEVKKNDPSANTISLESEIDRLVYQLYGLTEEEIKIVEGN